MNRNILCATDLSEASRPAFAEALRLGEALGGIVTVLHVAAPPYPARTYMSLSAAEAFAFREYAHRAVETAQRTLDAWVEQSGICLQPAVETRVIEGTPAEVILRTGDELQADLIVLGTHGRTGLPRLMLGSVAERVVRASRRPVLTVGSSVRSAASGEQLAAVRTG